jgi:tRNA A-37 threonylcarbamoyl transferase component Bud32
MVAEKIGKKIISDLKEAIPELALNVKNNFSLNQYKSKKNFVYDLVFTKKPKNYPKELILKIFRTENAENEYNTYKKLEKQGLSIPKILFFNTPYLLLEKVKGINLCDVINDNLINKIKLDELNPSVLDLVVLSIHKLAAWIAQLHSQNIVNNNDPSNIIVLNKGDTRLRDFIMNITNETIYGFDFEESYEGNYLDDLAWICCALLDTDPGLFEMFEPKHKTELANIFLKEYFRINTDFQFSFQYFAEKLIENLNIVIERRNLEFGPVSKSTILKNISKDY